MGAISQLLLINEDFRTIKYVVFQVQTINHKVFSLIEIILAKIIHLDRTKYFLIKKFIFSDIAKRSNFINGKRIEKIPHGIAFTVSFLLE